MAEKEYSNMGLEDYGGGYSEQNGGNNKYQRDYCKSDRKPLDISTAKCIPVLCDRIYDCVYIEDKQRKYLKDIKFTITSKGNYKEGEKICIEQVFVKYKDIGLIDEEIEVRIDSLENEIELYACNGSENCKCCLESNGQICNKKIYSFYSGTKMLDIDCYQCQYEHECEREGKQILIGEYGLRFYVCKAKVIVKGKIGCEPFRAESKEFSGELSEGFGFKEVDLFGNICLPCGKNRVDFQEIFEGCFSVDSISATQLYSEHCNKNGIKEFCADGFSTLLITKKIYATVKDELIVYTNPRKVICNDGTIDSLCDYGH